MKNYFHYIFIFILLLFDFSFNFYNQKEERWYALNRWYTCNYHVYINVRCSYISYDAHSLLPEIVERVKAYQSRRFIQFTNDRSAGKTSIFRSVDKFRIGIFVHLIGSFFPRFIFILRFLSKSASVLQRKRTEGIYIV